MRTSVWAEFTTHDGGPLVAGLRSGSGPPVVLLHGVPGLGFGYLRDLADDDSAERIPGAWVEVVEGAGHFIWFEAPGAVRTALRRLTGA